jgi:hypothetical protein
MSLEVIQYPLTTVLVDNQYPLAKGYRVLVTLWQHMLFAKLPIPSKEFVRGLPITSDTLRQVGHRVANTLLPPVTNSPRGLPTTYGIFARGLPQLHKKGQPLCNTK